MSFYERIDELKRKLIRQALRKSHGNMAEAGRVLGFNHRNTIIHNCDRLGIDPSAFERKTA